MAIYAKRGNDESQENLQRRFKSQVQSTGMMKVLRSRSTNNKKINKRARRERAIDREIKRSASRKKQFYSNM